VIGIALATKSPTIGVSYKLKGKAASASTAETLIASISPAWILGL